MMYLHLWLVHVPIWISVLIAMDVHQTGLPDTWPSFGKQIVMAALLGAIMGGLTAHAHGHYLQYVKDLI